MNFRPIILRHGPHSGMRLEICTRVCRIAIDTDTDGKAVYGISTDVDRHGRTLFLHAPRQRYASKPRKTPLVDRVMTVLKEHPDSTTRQLAELLKVKVRSVAVAVVVLRHRGFITRRAAKHRCGSVYHFTVKPAEGIEVGKTELRTPFGTVILSTQPPANSEQHLHLVAAFKHAS